MECTGRVFMLDDDMIMLNMYHDILEARGYDVFTTNNAYKFLLYAKEVTPTIFIIDVNMPQVTGWEVVKMIAKEPKFDEVPIVMYTISSDRDLAHVSGIAHFLHKPVDTEKLIEVIDAYCAGHKKHDILLIEDYEPEISEVKQALDEMKIDYFEVNDVRFANVYLGKNKPKIVCVKFDRSKFDEVKDEIHHDKIFYVENRQNIKELSSLLK